MACRSIQLRCNRARRPTRTRRRSAQRRSWLHRPDTDRAVARAEPDQRPVPVARPALAPRRLQLDDPHERARVDPGDAGDGRDRVRVVRGLVAGRDVEYAVPGPARPTAAVRFGAVRPDPVVRGLRAGSGRHRRPQSPWPLSILQTAVSTVTPARRTRPEVASPATSRPANSSTMRYSRAVVLVARRHRRRR